MPTAREGPALGALQALKEKGARFASCGTCLDHLGLRENLLIGGVGSMEATVQVMSAADRVISPC